MTATAVSTATATATDGAEEDLPVGTRTVSGLHGEITAALSAALPDRVWVVGEVVGKRQSPAGHVYLDLVERRQPGGPVTATLKVTCLARDLALVRRRAMRAQITISDGVQVRIAGRVATYAPSGALQLQMCDIDAAWTVGRLAADKDLLLRRLDADGVLAANKRHQLAALPLRVGLVTSADSAAYHDFCHELGLSGYSFQVLAVDTRVQGEHAPEQIVASLARLARDGSWTPDVVVVARGGGSRTDLAAFDDERVARAIAAMPCPVVTGIGHEIDRSVADVAAHTMFKTPTAVAQALTARVSAGLEHATVAGRAIRVAADRLLEHAERTLGTTLSAVTRSGTHRLERAGDQVDTLAHRIAGAADRQLDTDSGRLEGTVERLLAAAPRLLDNAGQRLAAAASVCAAHDPLLQLRRGFSITRLADGSRADVPVAPGTVLLTTTAAGTITSEVTTSHPTIDLPGEPR